MQTFEHTITAQRTASGRAMGLTIAIVINAAFVTALVVGLRATILHTTAIHDLIILPPKATEHHFDLPAGPHIVDPSMPTAVKPIVDIAPDESPGGMGITTRPGGGNQGIVFLSASGIVATHTIPPYPAAAIALGEEGKVRLHLTIAPDGTVSGVSVARSSGFADLDRIAGDWVRMHWRYRPAMRGGVAVESSLDADILFDLKNAH